MVNHGDIEQALRNLKKNLQREGRSLTKRRVFEKPSDKIRKKKIEMLRKFKKLRKKRAAK